MNFHLALVGLLFYGHKVLSIALESELDEEGEGNLRGGRALKAWPPKGFTTDPTYNCSITCAPCPIGCLKTSCSSTPIYIPPKDILYPSLSAIQRPWGPYPIARNATSEYLWWTTDVLAKYPKMIKQSDTKYALSDKDVTLLKMGLTEWMEARAAGKYNCVDIVNAVAKRALYLQEVQHMNQFMYWGTFDWIKVAIKEAQKMDNRAAKKGTSAIAPMYCYPIPIKGTISTIDFPSSVGFAALHTVKSKVDAAMITLLKKAKGVQFGKTNVPEMACCGAGINWANGISLNPWGSDILTGGSSAGTGSLVASYVTTVAIAEDTGGSTNGPAFLQSVFGYDPPKFHYPNMGNPSLTVRNDQIGMIARNIDDIIAFDMALLRNEEAHAKAASFVAGLSNKDIRIGCSDIYYDYSAMSPAIAAKYYEAKNALMTAGFTFVETCASKTRTPDFIVPSRYSNTVYIDELQYHLTNNLKINMSVFEVMLNGVNSFSTSYSPVGSRIPTGGSGCVNSGWNVNQTVLDEYLGRVPALRSDVYNEYYNQYNIDLVMGPTHFCDFIKWTDDLNVTGSCNGTVTPGGSCGTRCRSLGTRGTYNKEFTKGKYVVPIGLTSAGGYMNLHFMSRAGPKHLANVSASTWVYDEEGPKTWNLEDLYIIKRMVNVLAAAGMKRADAPMNFISGLL